MVNFSRCVFQYAFPSLAYYVLKHEKQDFLAPAASRVASLSRHLHGDEIVIVLFDKFQQRIISVTKEILVFSSLSGEM